MVFLARVSASTYVTSVIYYWQHMQKICRLLAAAFDNEEITWIWTF